MKKHYNILILGISFKTASIAIREKLAFTQEAISEALQSLHEQKLVEESALLSTCNRTEIYCRVSGLRSGLIQKMVGWWKKILCVSGNFTPYIYAYTDEGAVKHLLSVASGLDSMILGEPQILGQLKKTYQIANRAGVMGKHLSRLFQLSFSTAKKIRAGTSISTYPVSVAFAAVTLAKKIFSDLSCTTVLLIGAGDNTDLILQHLLTKQIKRIIVLNRTLEKARLLANRYGVEYDALETYLSHLRECDIVISSVATERPLLQCKQVHDVLSGVKHRPRLFIDLGVPRNIAPEVGEHEDIYLYSVDDLESIISQNKKHRENAAIEAEKIVNASAEDFIRWMRSEKQIKTIRTLRQRADTIKQDALRKAYRRLEKGEDPKTVVALMLHQLTQKLMHPPTISLRKASSQEAEKKISITKELFDLE